MGVTPLSTLFDKLFRHRFPARFTVVVLGVVLFPGCLLHRHRKADLAAPVNPGDQPDKILYEKAVNEIEHGRYDVGRLTLQTLLNTYPDSEFLAKAKLAIADSYYNEGGVSGLTQAEQEYKDFITFFPTAPEAPEAQFRAGMAHFRLMGKPDRDRTEARLAEVEFKEFLLKYPDSDLMPRVKARLRAVQEVLAEGEFKVAKFYYTKQANRAARSRFQDIADNYPNFSQADSALWYLGQTLERLKQPKAAAPYYARIVTDHPLGPLVADAKQRLTAMHQPIPRATKATLARAEADRAHRVHRDVFQKLGGALASGPDLSATRHGPVHLGGPRPGEVEVAKAPSNPSAPGNTVVVRPVGDSALESGKAVDSKTSGNGSGEENKTGQSKSSDAPDAKSGSNQPAGANSSDPSLPPKKKARKHVLKKLLKPF